MQIVIDVMDDGMATVTVDGGEPMGPMPAEEAMDAIEGMMPAGQDEEAMFREEAAKMEAPASDDMMEEM